MCFTDALNATTNIAGEIGRSRKMKYVNVVNAEKLKPFVLEME